METPCIEKIVEIELSRLKNENRLVLDDNLTPFSLKVRSELNKDQFLFDSPLKHELKKSNTLDALNLELIEFPKFKETEKPDSASLFKEKQLEDTSNEETNTSMDSSDVELDHLNIDDSPMSSKQAGYEAELHLLKMFDSKIENADISLEEFPLYEFQPTNNQVIDDEVVLKGLDDDSAEEEGLDTVFKRTRHKAKTSSPLKKKSAMKKSKSKIPLPTTNTENIRRSKRLEPPIPIESPAKRRCSPNKKINNKLKPVLRIKSKSSLNLIVDSSTGQLHEATKYATEINANNGEGIPLPKTTNEQVTVPINGPRRSKIPKVAIVKGFTLYEVPGSKKDEKKATVGFYSEDAYKKYFNPKTSPSKVMKPSINLLNINTSSPSTKKSPLKKKRSVHWAEQLEW